MKILGEWDVSQSLERNFLMRGYEIQSPTLVM